MSHLGRSQDTAELPIGNQTPNLTSKILRETYNHVIKLGISTE